MRCFHECFGIVDYLNKNAQVLFVINFPISICLYLLQIKIKISWKKITVIREGEWRIHGKMSQWLWNPSSLKFGMNLLDATPSCDNEMQHLAVTDYSQLWLLSIATVSYNTSCDSELQHPAVTVLQVKIYEFEICVCCTSWYVFIFIFHNNTHALFQHYVIFLRVVAAAATDRVSQYRFSMLEIFGMDVCYI